MSLGVTDGAPAPAMVDQPSASSHPAAARPSPARRVAESIALHIAAGAVAVGIASLLVVIIDGSPQAVYEAFYNGSLARASSVGRTIDEATPLLLIALGAIVSTRAGMFNIGQEGQLMVGAVVCGAIGLFVPGPAPVVITAMLAGAALGGGLWAGIPALLHFRFKLSVVLTTLLLTFVGAEILSFAVGRDYLLQEAPRGDAVQAQTSDALPADVRLPRLGEFPGLNVTSGALLALVLAVAVAVLLGRSPWGFRLRLLGQNARTARRMGVNAVVVGSAALMVSGAAAGLAGGVVLGGSVYRVQPGIANNLGYEGLLVALVARRRPGAAVPVALLFGAVRAGGGFLASTGVPRYMVGVVQALAALAAVFPPAYEQVIERRRQRAAAARAVAGGAA